MKIDELNTAFAIVVFLTILIIFLSYRYVVSVKDIEIQRSFYLFKQAVEQEKMLMQPEQMFWGDSKAMSRPDSVIVETEKGEVLYERDKLADRLTLSQKREWFFQMFIDFKNPNRAFMLDNLFQEQLRSEGIIAQTAVSFSRGDSLVSCSDKLLSRTGIALEPITFGAEHDQRQIKLQAYVQFSRSYLLGRMPLIWGLILLGCMPAIVMLLWQLRKKVEHNKVAAAPITPIPAALSFDASEWKEITSGVCFNKGTGGLKNRDHEVRLTRNRLLAFICFLEAPDHTVSYSDFCKEVLGRPLNNDESTEESKKYNRATRKSMTQTIQRLREDLKDFPGLAIENTSGLCYRLNIETVWESDIEPIIKA